MNNEITNNQTEGQNDSETNNSRREFLKTSGAIVALAMTGGAVLSSAAQAQRFGPFQASNQGTLDLGPVSGFKLNTLTDKVSTAGLLISSTSDGLIALSSRCTHNGCDVQWQTDAKTFVCPCHRAEFSNTGDALRRPAREPLPRYPLTVKNGHLLVDTNTLIRRSSVTKTDFLKVK
jgi:Rieske Fe-S protein